MPLSRPIARNLNRSLVDSLLGGFGGFTPNSIAGLFFQGEKGTLLATTFLSAPTSQTGSSSRDLLPRPMLTFNGTTQSMTVTGLLGSVTVVSKDGTSTPTVSAGSIAFTAGTIFNLLLSNGSFYPVVEGVGTTAFDTSVNAAHGTLVNAPTWGTTANAGFNPNNLFGYTNNAGVLVPARNATTDAQGNPLQFTGKALSRAFVKNSNVPLYNGTTQYTNLTAHVSQINTQTTGRVSGRFRIGASANFQQIWGAGDDTNVSSEVALRLLDTGRIHFLVRNNGTISLRWDSTVSYADNLWHTYDITMTNAGSTIVIDEAPGVGTYLVGTASTRRWFSDVTGINFLALGANKDSGGLEGFLNGSVCDTKIYAANGVTELFNLPQAEGGGTTAYNIAGNGLHGTYVNAPTWITQNVFARNLVRGFNKYMAWDGSDDYVSIPIVTGGVTNATIEIRNIIPTDVSGILLASGTLTGNYLGAYDGTTNALVNNGSGSPTMTVDGVAFTGTRIAFRTLISNGLPHTVKWVGVNLTGWTEAPRLGWFEGSVGYRFEGMMSNITFDLTSDGIVDHNYNGYGNTTADWRDTVGSAHGTVVGSPVAIRIPANGAVDAFGAVTRNLPIAGHNDAESVLDFKNTGRGGVAIAETAFMPASFEDIEFGENWASLDYAFRRARNSVVNDRHTIFPANLTGVNLTKMEAYVA